MKNVNFYEKYPFLVTLAPWGSWRPQNFFKFCFHFFKPIPKGNFFLLLHFKIPIFIFRSTLVLIWIFKSIPGGQRSEGVVSTGDVQHNQWPELGERQWKSRTSAIAKGRRSRAIYYITRVRSLRMFLLNEVKYLHVRCKQNVEEAKELLVVHVM